ncbi:hypothetical protein IVA95_04650 [Bradyrhizobium sp. 157]|uniref:hypothetical protein n=1 Tax=Bradyrhizobium sp. 157 TaxID=2782631 RepID=UPI001FF8DD2A|nr:hypothetical protein [Bradyrhizobium sp. 157]MCK1636893.1 hypothetical protein [Bradyrhizobium sp. 157]
MRETFAIWTGDWVASPHDDLVLMPMAENEVYQKAFATLNAKYSSRRQPRLAGRARKAKEVTGSEPAGPAAAPRQAAWPARHAAR